ncbi:hypothetical protein HRM2_33970 [Desulforapulum autotrophicum HRM2]|uniref:Uncharacterized protein n=1 Tax=Desulforapulum autotrophicum (strain ATCC 43914 / DSM 3382 / VKM B-1955 / HRM2) TaxID=177437 RepID=C0QMF5_DESAH|nr:hypothetical protein HRM2_33970 [Desulforapulum autotrophicum HRM2]
MRRVLVLKFRFQVVALYSFLIFIVSCIMEFIDNKYGHGLWIIQFNCQGINRPEKGHQGGILSFIRWKNFVYDLGKNMAESFHYRCLDQGDADPVGETEPCVCWENRGQKPSR